MAKDPAFLFYPNDYIGGTMGMTFEEKGAYVELLMLQFNRGHMTSHMIGQTVGQLWENIKCKFRVDDDGLFYNARLDDEVEKRKNFVKSRHNNISGKNQHSKSDGHTSSHMDGHMTSHMENENVNRDIDTDNPKATGKEVKEGNPSKPKSTPKVDECFEQFWQAYPRKVSRQNAIKAFAKVDVSIDILLASLEKQKGSEQWQKDGGQFIPHPATWLNGRRWEDEVTPYERRPQSGQRTGNNQQTTGEDAAGDWNLDGITTL